MADDCPSLVEPAEHLPAGTADRFGSRKVCQRLELLVPRVDTEVRRERHQCIARAKDGGHLPGTLADGDATVKRAFFMAGNRGCYHGDDHSCAHTCAPRTPFSSLSHGPTAAEGGRFPAATIVSVGDPPECSAAPGGDPTCGLARMPVCGEPQVAGVCALCTRRGRAARRDRRWAVAAGCASALRTRSRRGIRRKPGDDRERASPSPR